MPTPNPNPGLHLNLQQNERVKHIARRHKVVLVRNESVPLLLWLLCSFVFLGRIPQRGFDSLNTFLFIAGTLIFVLMIYIFFDWRNDILIVTTQRVIFQDARFLISVQRNELYNRDIQDVRITTESVIARYFNFGQVNVETTSRLRNIAFKGVARPGLVREVIMRNIDTKSRRQEHMRQVVQSRVMGIGEAPDPAPPMQFIPEGGIRRGILGIIPPNPVRQGDSIIWHKHWVYLFEETANPILLVLIVMLVTYLLRRGGATFGGEIVFGVLLVLLFLAIWIIYEFVDWRNDEYIISPRNVIDIERKPLGRETKRETTWDRVEKVALIQPNILSRFLDYGNIELSTAGQQESFTFRGVGSPERVLAIISDYRDHFQRRARDQEFDSTLLLLNLYHELLKEQQALPPAPPPPLPPTQPLP